MYGVGDDSSDQIGSGDRVQNLTPRNMEFQPQRWRHGFDEPTGSENFGPIRMT